MPNLSVTIDTGEAGRLSDLQDQMPSVIRRVMRDSLKTLLTRVQRNTPTGIKPQRLSSRLKRKRGISQVRWVQTGDLKGSWLGQITSDGIEVRANVKKWKYPHILEEGRYPGVGKPRFGKGPGGTIQVSPRTVSGGGGIFSSRAPQGILSPITKDTSFMANITQSIVDQLRAVLG